MAPYTQSKGTLRAFKNSRDPLRWFVRSSIAALGLGHGGLSGGAQEGKRISISIPMRIMSAIRRAGSTN
jgi:chorismate synthase